MSGAETTVVGAVNFGPAQNLWQEQPTLRELYDQACAGLIRMECENEELRAEAATAAVERQFLIREIERLREIVADGRAKGGKI
jgi:hypothetical protein